MLDWNPYLQILFGNSDRAQIQISQTVNLKDLLDNPELPIEERLHIISMIMELDSLQQVLLTPVLMASVTSPSRTVRKKILKLTEQLVADKEKPLRDALIDTFEPRNPKKIAVQLLLDRLTKSTGKLVGEDLKSPFSEILRIRPHIFILSTLLAVTRWALSSDDADINDIFDSKNTAYINLIDNLEIWMTSQNIMLRYLLVQWMAVTGESLIEDQPTARAALQHLYKKDKDALVAGAAVEQFAALTESNEIKATANFLNCELQTFSLRPLIFSTLTPQKELTQITSSLITAMGELCRVHIESDTALGVLSGLVKTWPNEMLNLNSNLRTKRFSKKQNLKIFQVAMHLRRETILVLVRKIGNGSKGVAGFDKKLILEDPGNVLSKNPNCLYFWVRAQPGAIDSNPVEWHYAIEKPSKPGTRDSSDLLPLISPVMKAMLWKDPPRPSNQTLWLNTIGRDIEEREAWIRAGWKACTTIITHVATQQLDLHSLRYKQITKYIADMAVGINRVPYNKTTEIPVRKQLKDLVTQILLNDLARPELINLICDGSRRVLQAQLITDMAVKALGALPGESTQTWLLNNFKRLKKIAEPESPIDIRMQGKASAILYLYQNEPELKKAFGKKLDLSPLPEEETFRKFSSALMCVQDSGIQNLFERHIGSWENASDLVNSPDKNRSNYRRLIEELLARELHISPNSVNAMIAAAACLSWQDEKKILPSIIRLRLLQSYAQCSVEPKGAVRRLLDHLLRTASSVELGWYQNAKAQALAESDDYIPQFDETLIRRLVRFLHEPEKQNSMRWQRLEINRHQLRDHMQRRPTILRELVQQANQFGSKFEYEYRKIRMAQIRTLNQAGLVSAHGTILPGSEKSGRIYSVLKPDISSGTNIDIATTGCNHISTFTWFPRYSSDVRSLVHFTPVPSGALDFHSLSLTPKEKTDLLDKRLRSTNSSLVLCGRVVKRIGHTAVHVDIGVRAKFLHSRHIVDIEPTDGESPYPSADDVFLVELFRHSGTKQFVSKAWLELFQPLTSSPDLTEELEIYDLRQSKAQEALSRLEYLTKRYLRDNKKFGLRADLAQIVANKNNPDQVFWYLDCGFRYKRKERFVQPAIKVNREQPEPDDSFIVVPQQCQSIKLEWEQVTNQNYVMYRILPFAVKQANHFHSVSGCLISERNKHNRRRWYGLSGKDKIRIERSNLTVDLETLYDLDALPDNHATLERLKSEELQFAVIKNKNSISLSLRHTTPLRDQADLLISIQADQVAYLTYNNATDDELIFEVTRRGGVKNEHQQALPVLGYLVAISKNSLFDQQGNPVEASRWERGDRIFVSVQFCTLEPDGSLTRRDKDFVGAWPQLQMIGDVQKIRRQCIDALKADTPIKVSVKKDNSNIRLELLPGILPEILPNPETRIEKGCYSKFEKYETDSEIDVVIAQDLAPEDACYQLTIKTFFAYEIPLKSGQERSDVASLLNLRRGSIINKTPKISYDKKENIILNAAGLGIFPDPLLFWLLPAIPKKNQPVILDDTSVRITNINKKSSNRGNLVNPEKLPEIPKIQELKNMMGLVTSVPPGKPKHGSQQSSQIGVRWIGVNAQDEADETSFVSGRWSFDPSSVVWQSNYRGSTKTVPQFRLGDQFRVALRDDAQISFKYQQLSLNGTYLHQPISWEEWLLHDVTEQDIPGLLLQKGEDDRPWLFSFSPGHLVEIPTSKLLGTIRLKNAWQLDKIRFRIDQSNNAGETFEVLSCSDGILHAVIGKKITLQVLSRKNRYQNFFCSLYHPSFIASELRQLTLRTHELPPGFDADDLTQPKKITKTGNCSLVNYSLIIDEITSRNQDFDSRWLSFSIRTELDQFVEENPNDRKNQVTKQSLVKELKDGDGRLDIPNASIIHQKEGYFVRLANYEPSIIPLPEEELTWIPMSEVKIPMKGQQQVTVIRSAQGPIASLRFNRPKTLEEWLKEIGATIPGRIVDNQKLKYYGEIGEENYRKLGLNNPVIADSDGDEEAAMEMTAELETDRLNILMELRIPGYTVKAKVNQILFLGEPLQLGGQYYGDSGLHTGDTITEFRIEKNEEDDSIQINILGTTPDIRYQVEDFTNQRGILFGEVFIDSNNTIHLRQLYGADRKGRTPHRSGKWNLRIEEPTEEQFAIIRDIQPGEFVYLKFVRADDDKGILWFRVLPPEEVFNKKNLIYVKPLQVGSYGEGSLRLYAQPLAKRIEDGVYFIPETQYSQRNGALQIYQKSDLAHICLAYVNKREEYRGKPSTTLSLTQNPPRKFAYLMSRSDWRGTVSQSSSNGFELELSPGTKVHIPFDSALVTTENRERIKNGAFVILNRKRHEWKVKIQKVIPSQIDYLPTNLRPWFFVQLWAGEETRLKWFQKHGQVNCSIIGYPQLNGLGRIQEADIPTKTPLPLAFKGIERNWISLIHSSKKNWAAGQLLITEHGAVELVLKNNERLKSDWNKISFFFGTSAECETRLRSWKWRNNHITSKKEKPENIHRSQVIARRTQDRFSLTACAEFPCPVEHLVEQYSDGDISKPFIVARSRPDSLILEIAPGRYAELPYSFIKPLHEDGKLREGVKINWESLGAGDKIMLSILTATLSRDKSALPNFQITRVDYNKRRFLQLPLVTLHTVLPDGSRILGLPGSHAIPADNLPLPPKDFLCDLTKIDKPFFRYRNVKQLFDEYGERLVLEGRVDGLLKKHNKIIAFIKIGIQIPIPGGKNGNPVFSLPVDDASLKKNDMVHVRVLEAEFNEHKLISFQYRVERIQKDSTKQLVRIVDERLSVFSELPMPGDSVFIFCPTPQEYGNLRVVGFEDFSIVWMPDDNDSLNLHNPSEIQFLASNLLDNPSSIMAATVESVNEFDGTIHLSRKNQLESVRLKPNQVGRGRLLLILSQKRLLVDILGVPVAMQATDFCTGRLRLNSFKEEFQKVAKGSRCEIEFVWLTPKKINCTEVYQPLMLLPEEFGSRIEFVAETGLTALAGGVRYFVPRAELAWCRLDPLLMNKLFRRGNRLSLRATTTSPSSDDNIQLQIKTSHIDIHDIRSQKDQILHNQQEPVYVTVVAKEEEKNRVIVRGQSGLLMELPLENQLNITEGDRFPAYVHNIDTISRIIKLSREDRPPEQLNLPVIQTNYAVDLMSNELIKARLQDLRDVLSSDIESNFIEWLENQSYLEPGPRTIRSILEIIHEMELDSAEWWNAQVSKTSGDSQFLKIWRDFSRVLNNKAEEQSICPGAKFALGYRCLTETMEIKNAVTWFESLAEHPTWSNYFDTQLCRTRIDYLQGNYISMTQRLKKLSSSFFNNALRTIIPSPTVPMTEPDLVRKLSRILASGDISKIKQLAKEERRRVPDSPHALSLEIWSKIVSGQREGIVPLLERFLSVTNAEREASKFFSDFDPRWLLWSAWLCFTQGLIVDGWYHLKEMFILTEKDTNTIDESLNLARIWYAWLANQPLPEYTDRSYQLLFELFQQCRWRTQCDEKLFDEFWNISRNSLHRWILDIPECHAVSSPNLNSFEELTDWCTINDCRDISQSLAMEIDR